MSTSPNKRQSGAWVKRKKKGKTAVAKPAPKWVDSTTMDFPKELPIEYEYKQSRVYVRECYPQYYKHITDMLKDGETQAITVTGTPGVGKSLFFAYFLKRYSSENPLVTIITASFKKTGCTSTMTKVAVWKNSELVAQAEMEKSAMMEVCTELSVFARNGLLYLYDGPPDVAPVCAQMVCFTAPDELWFKQNAKDQYHCTLFMPPWELRELQTAAQELALEMNPRYTKHSTDESEEEGTSVADLVERRFCVFGGVTRECLSTSARFVKNCEMRIENIIEKCKAMDQVRDLLSNKDGMMMHPSICQNVPDPMYPDNYTVAIRVCEKVAHEAVDGANEHKEK
ncbi:hypothetical protein PC129_g5945 [Phytophthora cactorum]|uniref:Uncharacterized protein n=1 Tax=Phytophthora cactorum TaxID=29920 RepID=A0A329S7J7_9STRA|nr:hypothetical protein PC111_g4343 [Phytophthora cactorum]KAG2838571.1 hypothetical protein PC112_g4442 [Phytophthora cactorum]KAG2864720.1 hypothetical protein PC113_g4333 [Phytophthora cactorum]KAG2923359.1 hypothetical protein PC114_g4809 [Phytophthora cactorum]KAG2928831.1 hypothetical protein PC115_g7115 [Phytophthora cactorum]